MKKSRRTYNGVHLNKKSNTQDVVEQSLTYIVNSLKLYNENELFPIIITSITYKEVDNPRIAFKNENGIIHLVLCFEHDKED